VLARFRIALKLDPFGSAHVLPRNHLVCDRLGAPQEKARNARGRRASKTA
jgi:hypothetical protein